MRVRLYTLGRLSVAIDGTPSASIAGKPVRAALLVYVAVEGETTREAVAGLLWPDSDRGRARHALSQTLYEIRRDLPGDVIAAEGEALRRGPDLWVDAAAFVDAVEGGRFDEAASLYPGAFLPSVRLADTNALETWTDVQRARLARLNRRARRERIRALRASGDAPALLRAAQEWAEMDPWEDEAQHTWIELLADLGQREEAVRRYEEHRQLLAREQLEPLGGTRELIEGIRAGRGPPSPGPASPDEGPSPDGDVIPAAVPPPRRGTPSRLALAGAAAVLLTFGAGLVGSIGRGDGADVVEGRVLVLPLDNQTGEATLDPVGDLAADWISEGLSRTGRLQVVPTVEVLRRLRALEERGVGGGADVALDLARDVGAGILVSGRFYRDGDGLELHTQITDVASGELWLAFEPVSLATDDPGPAVEELRQRVTGILAARASPDVPLEPPSVVHPPTYAAWLAYRQGVELFIRGAFREAIPHLDRARRLDSTFVRPLLLASSAHGNLGDTWRQDSIIRLLEERADALAPYERAHVAWARASLTGDLDGAYRAGRRVAELAPGGPAHYLLASLTLRLGMPRETIGILEEIGVAPEWLPTWWSNWPLLTGAYHALGRYDRELEEAGRAVASDPRASHGLLELRALAALDRVEGALDGLETWLAAPDDAELDRGTLMRSLGIELRAHGHERAAASVIERAAAWYRALPGERVTENTRWGLARAEYLSGRIDEGRRVLATLRAERPERLDYLGFEGVLAARGGDRARARDISRQLADLKGPYVHGENTYWRAAIATGLGDGAAALDLLEAARSEGYGLGVRLHAEPLFEPLWDAPAYQALIVARR